MEIIKKYEYEVNKVIEVLNSLKSFKFDSINIYGSIVNKETFVEGLSDIDMIVMSRNFNDLDLNKICSELQNLNLDFREKKPSIIEDNLCKRIEFYLEFEKISIDITLCAGLIPSREILIQNAWYDNFEALMGAIYINSKAIYGEIPDYKLFKNLYYPFYDDDLRKKRLNILCKKLKSYNRKIMYYYNNKNLDFIDNLIKARKFFIKILFIYYRKYYWTPEKHIFYQLDKYLELDESEKKMLSFSEGDMFKCADNYLKISQKYLEKIHKELNI